MDETERSMNKEITLTPEGGNFYRAMTFHWTTVVIVAPLLFVALIIAIVNPFWFRDWMFNFVERKINQFTRWRNNLKYRIYLGCDPVVWHTLKGDLK
jgi:hypothetical protein